MARVSIRKCVLGALLLAASGNGCSGKSESKSCEEGDEGCACYPNHTCNGELSCLSDLCVDASGNPDGTGGASVNKGGNRGTSTGSTASTGSSASTGGKSATSGGKAGSTGGTGNTNGGTTANGGSSGGASSAPTPVDLHGALSVSGTDLVDASGARVKLEGMSSMWLNWDVAGYAQSKEGLQWMRDNWSLRVFRIAMGVEPMGAYLTDPAKMTAIVDKIVQNAIDVGVYVIIDWHDHTALAHQTEALAFFRAMSAKWGSYPNVIYEVFNEPLDLDWNTQLKPYHQALVAAIREKDADNVILLGTPNWDQDVDVAASSPLSGKNLMYTLHFYACTHQATQRNKAKNARSLGLPMFVSEWGATHADGGVDGVVCEAEARTWHDWLDTANISWTAWKLDGCTDSSCMFKNQMVPVTGGWTNAQLNGHAQVVIDEMKTGSGMTPVGTGGTSSTGTGGTSSTGTGGTGGAGAFPPNPAGCALVSSCTSCCSTSGVFALDAASDDATSLLVRSFSASATGASASFQFTTAEQIGAIFFKLASPQDIGFLGLSMGGSGGFFEVALVEGAGANGCIYDVIGGELDSIPSACWGDGAGPAVGLPADQIEVRVRSTKAGAGSVSVTDLQFLP
ncbi:MAG TPA: glycoside hydrolase family 5 protein [Polyangiaceae bacterium]|nr:glycoside hydrolase family 5 protein [Polyangiaceae bacterium]